METILLLAHTDADGSLPKAALEALGTAKSLGGNLVIGLVGADVQAAANSVAAAAGRGWESWDGWDGASPTACFVRGSRAGTGGTGCRS